MNDNNLSYLIIGAGGTGGAIGAYMARAGKDVTLIARGAHLKAMKEKGLAVLRPAGDFTVEPIHVSDMENYNGSPDVILVCVKGYAVAEAIPFIKRVAKPDTVIIPILNIYGTGGMMQKELPDFLVTDGCMYIASEIKSPGVILMKGNILRVIFGVRSKPEYRPVLAQIHADLTDCDIACELSDNIQKDALLKFSYVSPQGACGLYYDVPAGPIKEPGEIRDCFIKLIREINSLALAMGIHFDDDIVARNLAILESLDPTMTTSMQRDVAAGKQSEIDGLVYSVVRMGREYGVDMPTYEKIAKALQQRGL